jgi:hypothetical protein
VRRNAATFVWNWSKSDHRKVRDKEHMDDFKAKEK